MEYCCKGSQRIRTSSISAHVELIRMFLRTGQATFFAGGAYSTATEVFPNRWPKQELTSTYLTTLAVCYCSHRFTCEVALLNSTVVQPQTQQLLFWYFPYYSDAAFQRNRQTEQPVTQGVLFSQGSLMQPASQYTGAVHVVSARRSPS